MIYPTERIALFIDGPNFYNTTRTLALDVDYKALKRHFAETAHLVRASYFTSVSDDEDFQPLRPLLDFIEYNGWNVVTKTAHHFVRDDGTRKIKGNMAVDLAMNAVALAPRIDHAILFSGDRDFRALVAHLQAQGTRVSVASSLVTSPPIIADDLRRQADEFIELDTLRAAIARKPRTAATAA